MVKQKEFDPMERVPGNRRFQEIARVYEKASNLHEDIVQVYGLHSDEAHEALRLIERVRLSLHRI